MNHLRRRSSSLGIRAVLALAVGLLGAFVLAPAAGGTHLAPIGASPLRVPFVPSFKACPPSTVPNSEHGPPVAVPACHPSTPTSNVAKMGPRSIGFMRVVVCPVNTQSAFCTNPGGQMPLPDDRITGNIVDVECASAGTPGCAAVGDPYGPDPSPGPYTNPGGPNSPPTPPCFPGPAIVNCFASADVFLSAAIPGGTPTPAGRFTGTGLRISDHYNCDRTGGGGPPCPPDPSGPDWEATTVDFGFPIPMDCLPVPGPIGVGSSCGVNTTANALAPGFVIKEKAADVQLGQIQVKDSGPDGKIGNEDDLVFAVMGIFHP
jgi:hypothetical protein